jgi:hypothetical protein
MKFHKTAFSILVVALATAPLFAREQPKYAPGSSLTPEQAALVQQAIAREKLTIQQICLRVPVVETYIQDTRSDADLHQAPIDDVYMLSRVDFGKAFFLKAYERRTTEEHGFFNGSRDAMAGLSRVLGLSEGSYSATGFMDMMFVDPKGFDEQHYAFSFVRSESLGAVQTSVFEVHPRTSGAGRFYGNIWIEDEGGNIVRFNGGYTQSGNSRSYFFHVDSWRSNLQAGLWLPTAIYVDEPHRTGDRNSVGLKAQTYFWGYSLKLPTRNSENVSMKVDDAVDKSEDSQDVSPLQASRLWVGQAEDNVIERLVQAGLVAPLTPGGYESKVLDQIVVNLSAANNLTFPQPVRTRVMLTDTIEATTVGNTILISKGLLDSLPGEGAIASVVAMELAHVAMGHHIDTRYAFNDRMLFPDEATFQRINMYHSDAENAAAAKRAMAYLENSMYKDKLDNAAVFYAQLANRAKVLKAITTPTLGDSLLQPDGTPWLAELAGRSPKLNPGDSRQVAALPFGNSLTIDAWDDTVESISDNRSAPVDAAQSRPADGKPVSYRLRPNSSAQLEAEGSPDAIAPVSASNQGSARAIPVTDNAQSGPTPNHP